VAAAPARPMVRARRVVGLLRILAGRAHVGNSIVTSSMSPALTVAVAL